MKSSIYQLLKSPKAATKRIWQLYKNLTVLIFFSFLTLIMAVPFHTEVSQNSFASNAQEDSDGGEKPNYPEDDRVKRTTEEEQHEMEFAVYYPELPVNEQEGTIISLPGTGQPIEICDERHKHASEVHDYVVICWAYTEEINNYLAEVEAVHQFIKENNDIKHKETYAMGFSRGGQLAILGNENGVDHIALATIAPGAIWPPDEGLDPTIKGKIQDLKVPTFIIHSVDDPINTVEYAHTFQKEMTKYDKEFKIVIEDKCGHFFDMKCWENAVDEGIEFLKNYE